MAPAKSTREENHAFPLKSKSIGMTFHEKEVQNENLKGEKKARKVNLEAMKNHCACKLGANKNKPTRKSNRIG